MRAACVNGFRDGIVLHHVQRSVFAAALGGLLLAGCTEKPDDRMSKPNLPFATSNKSCRGEAALWQAAAVMRPSGSRPVARAAPKKSDGKSAGFDPSSLVGLAPPAIDRILGRPAGMRAEATSVEWSYIGQDCSLTIFFYPDIATGTLRVLKYKVANTKGWAGGSRACVNFLMMARNYESD
jgi:hypothetical protein